MTGDAPSQDLGIAEGPADPDPGRVIEGGLVRGVKGNNVRGNVNGKENEGNESFLNQNLKASINFY